MLFRRRKLLPIEIIKRNEMLQSLTETLQAASSGLGALPLAFLLGLVSSVGGACCALPAMGMLVAYSGTQEAGSRKTALGTALAFMLGMMLALIALGFVAGFIGQTAQAVLGHYWKLFAGFVAVVVGLAVLKMLPLKIPRFGAKQQQAQPDKRGMWGTALVGVLLGGGVASCSLVCNPGIFIVLGAAVLQGRALWGMLLMAAFSLGFSLPLSAVLFGVSLGKASLKAKKAEAVIRNVAGVFLVVMGFYLLATF